MRDSTKTAATADDTDNLAKLAECCEKAARKAAGHAASNTARRTETAGTALHDVKLVLDMESQVCAEKTIEEMFPGCEILGEETAGGKTIDSAKTIWIIDPIDGTVNFSHGLPWWCSSVAAWRNGRALAGAVCAPALGLCYTAVRGGAALRNGRPISVSGASDIGSALVLSGLDKHEEAEELSFKRFRALSRSARKTRVMGSAALDICQVASGNADAYYEGGIFLWDVAAASLIIEAAGGKCAIFPRGGGHKLNFVAAAPLLFDSITAALSD